MRKPVVTSFKAAAATLAVSLLLGCSGSSPESRVAKAKAFLEKKDDRSAIIELKNALQTAPDVGETRFLLGKALLQSGNVTAAEVEFGKAQDLKYPADTMAPYRAQALLLQGKWKNVVDQYAGMKLAAATDDADLRVTVAQAFLAQSQLPQAKAQLDQALIEQPGQAQATLLVARWQATSGDIDGAEKSVDRILAADPAQSDAWKLKGDIALHGRNDRTKAIAAYQTGAKLAGAKDELYSALIAALFDERKLSEARQENELFRKAYPRSLEPKYFDAMSAYHARDFDKARQYTRELLAVAPGNAKTLYLAATVELQLGALQQADTYVAKVLQALPENLAATKLQTEIRLRAGEVSKVIETLLPIAGKEGAAPDLFAMLGRAYLANGDVAQAQTYFERALKVNPDDAGTQTSLALTHLPEDGGRKTLSELGAIASRSTDATADLAIVNIAIQRSDWDTALKSLADVERKEPRNPISAMLKGRIENARGNTAAAVASFERAVAVTPTYFPAVDALASIDAQRHDLPAAEARFQKLLAVDPNNLQALLAMARIRQFAGDKPEAVDARFAQAIRLNPTEPLPRTLLVNRLLGRKQFSQALSVAQEASAAFPNDPNTVDALGRAQAASGDPNQAIKSFSRLAELTPRSVQPQLRLAEVYMSQDRSDAAISSLKKALAIEPGSLDAQRGLVSIELVKGNTAEALALSRALQQSRKDSPLGWALEGEILSKQKNMDAAANVYAAGMKQTKSTQLAVKLHTTLVSARRRADADQMASDWLKEHPKDEIFVLYLADGALSRKEYAPAEAYYRQVIALQPNSPISLNNLAWLSAKLGKPGALAYAERANTLAPSQPAVLDTLATLLADNNQLSRALELQKTAVKMAPDLPSLRLNLARLMIKSGDKSEARDELRALAKLGAGFPEQADVTRLLATL